MQLRGMSEPRAVIGGLCMKDMWRRGGRAVVSIARPAVLVLVSIWNLHIGFAAMEVLPFCTIAS
jgi:hypothetical protein